MANEQDAKRRTERDEMIRTLLTEMGDTVLISSIRRVRDEDLASAKAKLDAETKALHEKYKALGIPIRTLGPRKAKGGAA